MLVASYQLVGRPGSLTSVSWSVVFAPRFSKGLPWRR